MAQIIMVSSRNKLPESCLKAGESLGCYFPSASLATYLDKPDKVWTLTEDLFDETGAYRGYIVSYYVANPDYESE